MAQALTLQARRVWWAWLALGVGLTLAAMWFSGVGRPPRASGPSGLVQFLEPVAGRLAETGMFSVSPDGRHLVFAAQGADGVLRLWARTLSALEPVPVSGTEVPTIIPPVFWSPARRSPDRYWFRRRLCPPADSGAGAIVFARDAALFAQRFDEGRLAMIGDPIRLADHIGSYLDGAYFSVSAKTLIYRAPEPDYQLMWFDRHGRRVESLDKPARFSSLALSPDGTGALVSIQAPEGAANQDLWLFDFLRAPLPRRVSFGPALEFSPVWQTNDRFVFGSSGGASGVYRQTLDGERQLLFRTGRAEKPTSVSPDGRLLLYSILSEKGTGVDVWVRNESSRKEVFVTSLRVDPAAGKVSTSETYAIARWPGDSRASP